MLIYCGSFSASIVFLLGISTLCTATSVPRMTAEELTEQSDTIVAGRVGRSWPSWDRSHQFVWTHHEVTLNDAIKGELHRSVVVSEPGGTVDGSTMIIPGAVQFTPGEDIVLFLYRTPVGYLRTVGYGQGKYRISRDGRIHSHGTDATFVSPAGVTAKAEIVGTPLETLEGLPLAEFKHRVSKIMRREPARAE